MATLYKIDKKVKIPIKASPHFTKPEVGQSTCVGTTTTPIVTSIIEQTPLECKFKTKTETYIITYN